MIGISAARSSRRDAQQVFLLDPSGASTGERRTLKHSRIHHGRHGGHGGRHHGVGIPRAWPRPRGSRARIKRGTRPWPSAASAVPDCCCDQLYSPTDKATATALMGISARGSVRRDAHQVFALLDPSDPPHPQYPFTPLSEMQAGAHGTPTADARLALAEPLHGPFMSFMRLSEKAHGVIGAIGRAGAG